MINIFFLYPYAFCWISLCILNGNTVCECQADAAVAGLLSVEAYESRRMHALGGERAKIYFPPQQVTGNNTHSLSSFTPTRGPWLNNRSS